MKSVLLLLASLMFAVSAWAGDAPATSPSAQAAVQAAPAPETSASASSDGKATTVALLDKKQATGFTTTVSGLNCAPGCGPQTCGGAQVCAKNKTICGTPCP